MNMKEVLTFLWTFSHFLGFTQSIYQDEEQYYERNTFLIDELEFLSTDEAKDLKKLLKKHYQETKNPIWIRIKYDVLNNDSTQAEAKYMFSKLYDSSKHHYQTLILITSYNTYVIKHNWQSLADKLQDDEGSGAYYYAKEEGVSDLITYRLKVRILLHYIYHRDQTYKGLTETIEFIRAIHKQEVSSSDIKINLESELGYSRLIYGVIAFSAIVMILAVIISLYLAIRNAIRFFRQRH